MQQLKAYSSTSKIKEEGIQVVAASEDTVELARKTVKECDITFPMGYGLDPEFISKVTGAFYQKDPGKRERPYLHATNFILEPDGRVNVSVYSSGPAGRLACQDMLHSVERQKAARIAAETK